MMNKLDLLDKLNTITEAALSPQAIARIDELIAKLQDVKERDFEPYHQSSIVPDIFRSINNGIITLNNVSKSQDTLRRLELERQEEEQRSAKSAEEWKKFQKIANSLVERYPRYVIILKDNIKFVQPNGELVSIQLYQEGASSGSFNKMRINILYALRELFKIPQYDQLAARGQKIRDFGFNLSSKLLNTQEATFRTRTATITNVLFSYSGPYLCYASGKPVYGTVYSYQDPQDDPTGLKSIFQILDKQVDGEVTIESRSGFEQPSTTIEHLELGHLGEIIDTLDMLSIAIEGDFGTSATIHDIQLIGSDVVEYVLKRSDTQITIQSTEIRSSSQTAQLIFQRFRQAMGYTK